MNAHGCEPVVDGDTLGCACGEWATWAAFPDALDRWAMHAGIEDEEDGFDFNVEGQPEFNGAFA